MAPLVTIISSASICIVPPVAVVEFVEFVEAKIPLWNSPAGDRPTPATISSSVS